ncbi:unnamed protein product [Bursaphelenchus xylophilus]|uniref:(pine wood nematode) hypothetical protein n=1 Tax=Bursaphelenchus xylophilus TaxID=6326 RepID=A0A1I7S797_BURXY|nr:unnamed protein product [Bursaphelenchus xylophilus]CAG9084804.1 unnamed protein product [Bursaphelenchus xylophilus]
MAFRLALWTLFFLFNDGVAKNATDLGLAKKSRGVWNDKQILEDLMKRYRFPDTSANISVGVQLILENIQPSAEDLCNLRLIVNQKWLEPKLRYENLRDSAIPIRIHSLNYIWSPELIFLNALNVISINHYNIFVFPNGIVEYEQRLQLLINSDVNLENFPFERKNCSVILSNADVRASWNRLLDLRMSRSFLQGAGEWKILNFTTGHPKEVKILLKRSLNFWICTVFLPSLAFLTCSTFSVWFYQLGDRRQLMVTTLSFIGIVVVSCYAHDRSPKTTYWKAIDLWTMAVTITNLALLLSTVVLSAYQRQTGYSNYINTLSEDAHPLDKRRWIVAETPYYSQVLADFPSHNQHQKFIILGIILSMFGSFLFYFLFITVLPFYKN